MQFILSLFWTFYRFISQSAWLLVSELIPWWMLTRNKIRRKEREERMKKEKETSFEGNKEWERVGERTESFKGSFLSTVVFKAKKVMAFNKASCFLKNQQGVSSVSLLLSIIHSFPC